MIRHFYISDNLDDLDLVETQLEAGGVNTAQIHVISNDDSGIDTHKHLHNIQSVLKLDVVHGVIMGAGIGLFLAFVVLAVGTFTSIPESFTWVPVLFLAVVVFGFSTWWGGFHGIHHPHHDFKRFEQDIEDGKHVFIVDSDANQEKMVDDVVSSHPNLKSVGTGAPTPRWVVMSQKLFKDVTTYTFP